MIINGNGQQVCNLLILNTKNVAWPNWHVARHLTKKLKSHPQNVQISPKNVGGGGGGAGATLLLNVVHIGSGIKISTGLETGLRLI